MELREYIIGNYPWEPYVVSATWPCTLLMAHDRHCTDRRGLDGKPCRMNEWTCDIRHDSEYLTSST